VEASGSNPTCEHWLLTGMDPECLDLLLAAGRDVRFEPGEVIFREGDVADGLYLIMGGSVRLSATGDKGEMLLSMAHGGDIVGELGVLDAYPRSATAVSVGVCAAYFVPAEPFLDALEISSLACMKMMAHLTQRLRTANGRLGELAPTSTLHGDRATTDHWPKSA